MVANISKSLLEAVSDMNHSGAAAANASIHADRLLPSDKYETNSGENCDPITAYIDFRSMSSRVLLLTNVAMQEAKAKDNLLKL